MKILFYGDTIASQEEDLKEGGSIFLAGPTVRGDAYGRTESWRKEALRLLTSFGYEGYVFVPEFNYEVKEKKPLTDEEIWTWEHAYLHFARVVMFWVPRRVPELLGLTTNIEFGLLAHSGQVVFGAPPSAESVGYMRWICAANKIKMADTLPATLHLAVLLNAMSG